MEDAPRRLRRIALAAAALVIVAGSWPVARGDPAAGDWFEYDFNGFLTEGTGDYAGYEETMLSHSRYSIASVSGDEVAVQGQGTWTFTATDGSYESGTFLTDFTFSVSTRRYLVGIDVEGTYVDPAVWFWIPPSVGSGDTLRILDDLLPVFSIDETVYVGAAPRRAMLLSTGGSYTRDDVYGRFDSTYTDTYFFDRETGYVLRESYDESDVSANASFRWRAEVIVTASSFATPVGGGTSVDATALLLGLGATLAAVVAIALGVRRIQRGPSRFTISTESGPLSVRLRRIRSPADLDGLSPEASETFGPLLVSFGRRALLTQDPVVVATSGPRMVGLLTYDGESGLGSLFASDGAVARALLRRLRVQDFFAEPAGSGWTLPAEPVDSFKILERRDLAPIPYDPMVVRPMAQVDLPHAVRIAQEVYGGRAARWVDTCFRDGDLAYVGVADGRVVGFGFATVADHVGRLHTLTVLAPYRGRGIGTDLTAARLSALAALAVQRVVVEISRNNAASLRVATRAGFAPIGETVYYSRVPRSSAMAFQRQF